MEVRVRRADPNDARGIVSVLEGVAAERVHSAIDRAWTVDEQRAYMASRSPREAFHVAVTDRGDVIGYQSLDSYSPGFASMSHVGRLGTFVVPEWRARGVGRALFAHTSEFARRAGYRKLVIEVRGSNAPAQAFYRMLGFTPCGRLTGQVVIDGRQDDEVIFELFL